MMPHDKAWDSSLALFTDPYGFISKRCRQYNSDVFEARILLRPTICMTGREAAKCFYDRDRFTRAGAAPEPLQATLFGKGGVQGLDHEAHLHRKQAFMSLLNPVRVNTLAACANEQWKHAAEAWSKEEDRFGFIPQGGDDAATHHRCPGEQVAVELTKIALDFLTNRLVYEVPAQDLRLNHSQMPALPRSRFIIRNVGVV